MPLSESLYEKLSNVEDARLCEDIADDACRESPQSFALILASYILTKLGDAISSPKTTLAWASSAVGAPAFVLGFLVPLRESGSMIPQLFIGGVIRRLALRKWVWVAGSLGQCLAVIGIGLVVLNLNGAVAGWALLALVTAFSLARGLCSIAAKDVLGKTIPKPRRGQLAGWSASAAGLISIVVGLSLMLPMTGRGDVLAWLLLGAGLLWLAAAAVYTQIPERPGEVSGGRSVMQALGQLRLLLDDRPFRRFVMARALLMCSALSAPFYVALAQQNMGSATSLLGTFVAAAGLAGLVSGPFWGRFADRSSRQVMAIAGWVTSGAGAAVFLIDRVFPELAASGWFLPFAYFVLSVAHSGVRVGRKTYVVNLGSGNDRTDYVAISNTVIGVLLLVVGSVGALTPIISNAGVIALLALMGAVGAIASSRLE